HQNARAVRLARPQTYPALVGSDCAGALGPSDGDDRAIRRRDRPPGMSGSRGDAGRATKRWDRSRTRIRGSWSRGWCSPYRVLGPTEFAQLVIVDNASTDGSREQLEAQRRVHSTAQGRYKRDVDARELPAQTLFGTALQHVR